FSLSDGPSSVGEHVVAAELPQFADDQQRAGDQGHGADRGVDELERVALGAGLADVLDDAERAERAAAERDQQSGLRMLEALERLGLARAALLDVAAHSAGASSSRGWPHFSTNAFSTAAPTRYSRSSAMAGAMISRPTGRLSSGARPHGTEMAALPARLDGMVHRSARYIAIGSSARSPIGKAVVGVVGETSTSTSPKARWKSRVISVRTFCAEP